MEFPVERDDIEVVRLAEAGGRAARTAAPSSAASASTSPPEHQAANAAAALAALDALGLPRPERVDVEFSRWRGEELPLPGGGLLINDAYNANPVSMRAALAHLGGDGG